jgi:outer membrane immunogenic protein
MKKLLLIAGAMAAVLATPAVAAEMPLKAPPAPVISAWSWSGFYLGIDGGYGWNRNTGAGTGAGILPNGFEAGNPAAVDNVLQPRGGLFGGEAGYNWQSGIVVYGIEADIQWSGINGTGSVVDPCCNIPTFPGGRPFPPNNGIFAGSANLDWFGTARFRIGLLPTERLLAYVTAGVIYGRETASASLFFPNLGVNFSSNASKTAVGPTVGAGIEYAFTNNLSAKVEGLYYDLGTLNNRIICPPPGNVTCAADPFGLSTTGTFAFRGVMVRGGLNWHFNLDGGTIAGRN